MPKRPLYFGTKRAFDFVFSLSGLIAALPLFLFIPLIIWLETPGPVFFSQVRLGREGRRFRLYKFRKFPAECRDEGPGVTTCGDARMTRVGSFLESTKLDELPQLWNILKGEMSFVGPRPESLRFKDLFTGGYERVLDYIPGIFGPNQVAFRNESEMYPPNEDPEDFYRRALFPEKAENDLAYFSSSTFLKDLSFILKGLYVTIFRGDRIRQFIYDHGPALMLDLVLILSAWSAAYVLLYPELMHSRYLATYLTGVVLLPVSVIPCMIIFGSYRHLPGYFSLNDAARLARVITWVVILDLLFLLGLERSFSLYMFPLTWAFLMLFLALPRIVARLRREKKEKGGRTEWPTVVIYGAGRGGFALSYWFSNGTLKGLVDDAKNYKGRRVNGYPVLGHIGDLATIYETMGFEELWITFEPGSAKRKDIERICREYDIKMVVLPETEPFCRYFGSPSCN